MKNRSFLVIALLGLAGCGDWTTYAITLTNRSDQPVSTISANFAGQVKQADRIIRGQFIVLASHGGEGMICLTFRQRGTQKRYAIGYITENMPSHYQITIRDRDISVMGNDPVYQTLDEPRIHHPLPPGRQCLA